MLNFIKNNNVLCIVIVFCMSLIYSYITRHSFTYYYNYLFQTHENISMPLGIEKELSLEEKEDFIYNEGIKYKGIVQNILIMSNQDTSQCHFMITLDGIVYKKCDTLININKFNPYGKTIIINLVPKLSNDFIRRFNHKDIPHVDNTISIDVLIKILQKNFE